MEQKQLDEIEQSFTGEEFIEDDIIIEQVRPKLKPMAKTIAKPMKKEVKEVKEVKRAPEKKAEVLRSKASGMPEASPLSIKRVSEVKSAKADIHKSKASSVPEARIHKEKIVSKEAHKMEEPIQQVPKAEPKIEVWYDEPKEEKGMFKEVSTWKALTGIVLILLLLSVFTQGFNFIKGEGVTGAAISQGDAETQALAFVNDNLLQPPFVAQVTSTEEIGSLYKIKFSIAGEEVDSYMTKDGSLFFPQGFNPQKSLLEQLNKAGTSDVSAAPATEDTIEEVVINGQTGEVTTTQVPVEETETAPADTTTAGNTEYVIKAKKWLFSPNKITVPLGSTITLSVTPEEMDTFTFLLSAFGVRQEVSGPTTIQFTADRKGTFPFSCGSCEEFRGMTGTVVVE